MGSGSGALLLAGFFVACSGATPTPQSPAEPSGAQDPEIDPAGLRPELSVDEQDLLSRLAVHVQHLQGLGERTPSRPWELADASDYVARTLEELGYPLERQGYEQDGVVAQNLTVRAFGGERGDQVIVVGAHYDSSPGSSGARVGAGSTAALIELARLMQGAKLKRTIQFSAFALGESPHGDGEGRGARQFVRKVREQRARDQEKLARENEQKQRGLLPSDLPEPPMDRSRFVAMISLRELLSFRSQGAGAGLWVDVSSSPAAAPFAGAVARALDEPPFLVNRTEVSLQDADSDARAFDEFRVPVVVLDGNPEAKETDMDALTRVVMALRRALGEMAEERPGEDLLLAP
jgi:hypothetical protein